MAVVKTAPITVAQWPGISLTSLTATGAGVYVPIGAAVRLASFAALAEATFILWASYALGGPFDIDSQLASFFRVRDIDTDEVYVSVNPNRNADPTVLGTLYPIKRVPMDAMPAADATVVFEYCYVSGGGGTSLLFAAAAIVALVET